MWEFPSLLLEGENSEMKQRGALCAGVGRMLGVWLDNGLLQYVGEVCTGEQGLLLCYVMFCLSGTLKNMSQIAPYCPMVPMTIIIHFLVKILNK